MVPYPTVYSIPELILRPPPHLVGGAQHPLVWIQRYLLINGIDDYSDPSYSFASHHSPSLESPGEYSPRNLTDSQFHNASRPLFNTLHPIACASLDDWYSTSQIIQSFMRPYPVHCTTMSMKITKIQLQGPRFLVERVVMR